MIGASLTLKDCSLFKSMIFLFKEYSNNETAQCLNQQAIGELKTHIMLPLHLNNNDYLYIGFSEM